MEKVLSSLADIIDDKIKSNKAVLVHCNLYQSSFNKFISILIIELIIIFFILSLRLQKL